MKIKWWGHSSFAIESESGIKLITDPYGKDFPYQSIEESADIVTVSHDHFDHNAYNIIQGGPSVIKESGLYEENGIKIQGTKSKHDDAGGSERGTNIIFVMEIEDKRLAHLGDLGHLLEENQLKKLKNIDILMIPVGGHYTINAQQAYKICRQLEPQFIFPMHYKTDLLDFPIAGVEDFCTNFSDRYIIDHQKAEVDTGELSDNGQQVVLLDYVK